MINTVDESGLIYMDENHVFAGEQITQISLEKIYLNPEIENSLVDVILIWIKNMPYYFEINLTDFKDKEAHYKSVLEQWKFSRQRI